MRRISGEISLRPTRIGFLVRPEDANSVSRIMRWSTCLWGGKYNPIIPVGPYPADGCGSYSLLSKPDRDMSREYMEFFEPDVLVESESGLASSIGYGALSSGVDIQTQLVGLDELYSERDGYNPEFSFGLSVIDAYRDIYQSQRQFVLRDSPPVYVFNETKFSSIVEVVFGAFPKEEYGNDFSRLYDEVFRPSYEDVSIKHWIELFGNDFKAITPFGPTRHCIKMRPPRSFSDLSFFVFDHTKPTDLIDYWNDCLFNGTPFPIPFCWLSDLAPLIVDGVIKNYRPIPNNPSGIHFRSVIYYGHSFSEEMVKFVESCFSDCPPGSFGISEVLHPRVPEERGYPICERYVFEADRKFFSTKMSEDGSLHLNAIAPSFAADSLGQRYCRWSNVIRWRNSETDTFALIYPSNLEDRTMPRLLRSLAERPVISREGWVFGQQFRNFSLKIDLSDGSNAIGEWLERMGIKSEISDAGRIAKQMIESLGSLSGSYLIADEETIRLLDKMATREVVREGADGVTRRQYEGRAAETGKWKRVVSKRAECAKHYLPCPTLDEFTKRGILKLGLGIACSNCTHSNWFGLDDVSYEMTCERCLKAFQFPSDETGVRWKYRVIGPFSVPNFVEGAYCVVLTLNFFCHRLSLVNGVGMTYSTGLNLKHEQFKREVDFAFWYSESPDFGQQTEPRFVFGEAKSFASEAVTDRDIESLKLLAEVVPGSVVVVSVLKSTFSEVEKERLANFTKWGWEQIDGRPRAQLLLLTGDELFADFFIAEEWRRKGVHYPDITRMFRDLDAFARTTQKEHLCLDYYADSRET